MHLVPVLRPLFPISGILVIHTVIVYALTKDAKGCSKAYVNGLCFMELTLLSSLMATIAPYERLIVAWNMLLVASRSVLCPCWLWMALDMSGIRPAGLSPKKVYAFAMAPVALFSLVLFANPLLGWYWPSVRFDGRVLVVERSLLTFLNVGYCQVLLVLGSVAYAVGLVRHRGNERLRLVVLAVAYAFLFLGDVLWMAVVPMPRSVNPQSFFMTIGFYAVGASVVLYGFPRVRAPITEKDIEALPPLALPADRPGGNGAAPAEGRRPPPDRPPFPAPNELSERQLCILRAVMEGRHYKDIAEELGIAERTVKYHMGQILDKCGLETREQLIAWAARSIPTG